MTSTVTLTLTMTTVPNSTSAQASTVGDQLVILSTYVSAVTVSKPRSSSTPIPSSTMLSLITPGYSLAGSNLSSHLPVVSSSTSQPVISASSSLSPKQVGSASNSWKLGLAIGIPGAIALMIGLAAALLIISKNRKFAKTERIPPVSDLNFHRGDGASFSNSSCDDLEKNEASLDPFPERKPDVSSGTPTNTAYQSMTGMKSRLSRLFNWNDRITAQDPIISQVVKNDTQVPGGSYTPFTAILLKRFKLRSRLPGKSPVNATPPLPNISGQIHEHPVSEVAGHKDHSRPHEAQTVAQETGRGSQVSLNTTPEIKLERKFVVVRKYSLKLPDEMSIEVGDTVVVYEHFSDGWCKAGRGNNVGIVPLICLKKLESLEGAEG